MKGLVHTACFLGYLAFTVVALAYLCVRYPTVAWLCGVE